MKRGLQKCHKWAGLLCAMFIILFAVSGIVINHRHAVSGCNISRSWMPESYQLKNYNNGIIRGTLRLSDNTILAYGNAGVWKTDSCFSAFHEMNNGLPIGADNRKVTNLVQTANGTVWAATTYGIHHYDRERWSRADVDDSANNIMYQDIALHGDTMVVLSRSHVYVSLPPYTQFHQYQLKAGKHHKHEVTLYKTLYRLHSGELFGLGGQLFVDFIGVVLIILCVTGVCFTFFRRSRKFMLRWHNRLGWYLIVFTLLITITGMCLHAPFSTPLRKVKHAPLPGSTMASDNPYDDKLRAIRWDESMHEWLLIVNGGVCHLTDFTSAPKRFKVKPEVSGMGVNVFMHENDSTWVVGSLSGLYRWQPAYNKVEEYMPGKKTAAVGYSTDLGQQPVVFEKRKGAMPLSALHPMPDVLARQPISLWNCMLELHVGRLYAPLLREHITKYYVAYAGALMLLILISGIILYPKRKKKKD